VAEIMSRSRVSPVPIENVLAALGRLHSNLTDRNRAQLAALVVRTVPIESLDHAAPSSEPAWTGDDPEAAMRIEETRRAWADALGQLPREDAAIVRMVFGHGWTLAEVRRALHLPDLTRTRVQEILGTLRALLARRGVGPGEAAGDLPFLEGKTV
jgi:DNA-directed RNA polymerase specialized sigma24 family protein